MTKTKRQAKERFNDIILELMAIAEEARVMEHLDAKNKYILFP